MKPTIGIPTSLTHMSILQRCLVISVLFHVLLGVAFSTVVVTRQIVQYIHHSAAMVPLVNVQLSREMEVRTDTRQQMMPLPMPEPAILRAAQPMIHTPTPEAPIAIVPGIPAAQPDKQMTISLPTAAPRLTLPAASDIPSLSLAPVAPNIGPIVVTPLTPTRNGADPQQAGAAAGLLNAQLADASPVPFGAAPGAIGALPAVATAGMPDSRAGPLTGAAGVPGPFNAGPLAPQSAIAAPLPLPATPSIATPDALPQRSFDERQKLLQRYGGSAKTEASVALALSFLAKTQESDGHWTKFAEANQAGVGQTTAHDAGLTGLASLAFLAANYSPAAPSVYQEPIRKAIAYLHSLEKPDGDLRNGGNMYDQAIGTLALAEAAALTGDPHLRDAALVAAQFIIAAQNHDGGWRYSPRDITSDSSVLGWQVMALRSAERIGLQIPDAVRAGALENMKSKSSGRAGMLTGYLTGIPSSTMTAEALFSRLLLGTTLSDDQIDEVGGYLLQRLPDVAKPNYYYWYYGSLGLLQISNAMPAVWKEWNAHVSAALVSSQNQSGDLAGSWDSDGEWSNRGGRVYSTALGALTLEVYYRYPVAGSK